MAHAITSCEFFRIWQQNNSVEGILVTLVDVTTWRRQAHQRTRWRS